jgi:hypothetical protein
MPLFDLQQLFGTSLRFDITGSYKTSQVYVMRAEILYEVIRAHVMIMDNPELIQSGLVPENITEFFTGFVPHPQDITWYASYNPNKVMELAAMQAAKDGNMFAVAETLLVDNNNPPMQRQKKA